MWGMCDHGVGRCATVRVPLRATKSRHIITIIIIIKILLKIISEICLCIDNGIGCNTRAPAVAVFFLCWRCRCGCMFRCVRNFLKIPFILRNHLWLALAEFSTRGFSAYFAATIPHFLSKGVECTVGRISYDNSGTNTISNNKLVIIITIITIGVLDWMVERCGVWMCSHPFDVHRHERSITHVLSKNIK